MRNGHLVGSDTRGRALIVSIGGSTLALVLSAGAASADFAYGIPASIPAGQQLWKVVNEGAQPHEMLLAQLTPGATAMDFAMAAFDPAASGPPPGQPIGGLQAIMPGSSAWLELDLAPGTYAAICFVPDPESGQPHLARGMISEYTVEAWRSPRQRG